MKAIFVSAVLLAIASATLTCTTGQVYMKVSKQSKSWASEESYEIWGNGAKVAENPTLADNELRVTEFCVAATSNNQYTLKMKDSYGDSWTTGSWIMIEGIYGNIAYKGFLTHGSLEEPAISLYYGVTKESQWKLTSGSVSGSWTDYNFGDSSWTQVTLGSVTESVSGPQYFRKTFSGLSSMAAYELSMNYRYGIVAYINGVEVVRDNMPEGAVTSSTMAQGSYQAVEYHSFIRPGAEVSNAQSVLAVEIHFLASPGQTYVDFDAFLAIYASSTKTGEDACYVYPYTVTLTASQGTGVDSIFDWAKGSSFTATAAQLPTTVTYAISGPKAYINGVRVWPYSSPLYAPSTYTLQGTLTATSTTWTNILSATGLTYESTTFQTKQGYFNAALYANYRIQITSSSTTSLSAYEVQLVTCAVSTPSSIEFDEQQYSFYKQYQMVNIAPKLTEFTNCQINPAQPAGLTFDQTTCTLSGMASAAQSSVTYTITSTMNGQQYTGTFQLQIVECTGTLVNLLRTYKTNAVGEAFTIRDLTTQQAVYTVALNSGQVNSVDWNHVLCLTGTRYEIQMSSTYNYWQALSFLYVNAILADNDYDTIIRAKFDNNQGLEANPEFNAQFAIKPAESWYYKMGEVPSNWYGSDTSGWTSGTVGSFPASSNQIQLYKRTFNVASVTDIAGIVISLKYQYGCIIYLNNHEAFRLGFTGDLSTSSYSSISLPNANFRQISLPIKTMMIGETAAVDYITTGSNTIAIALVAAGPAQTTANFDCAVRLMDTHATSRVYDFTTSYSTINGSPSYIFYHYYGYTMYYSTCDDNYLQIAFDDNRHEWISSVAIKLYYTQGIQQPRQFVLKAKNEDETEWTTLKTVTGLSWSLLGQKNRIWIPNNKAYNMYRFENFATGSTTDCYWKLSMIDLLSDPTNVNIPALSYTATSIFKDIEMAEIYPNSDMYTDFTVSPALPTGVNIDPNTGIISGAASTISSQTYMINAKKMTGEAVTAQLALSVEVCTGGKSLITGVARIDGYPSETSYKLFTGKGTSGSIISQGQFMAANSPNYVDSCLNDGIYTFEFRDSLSDGWFMPAGWFLTVDVGAMKFEMGQVYTGVSPTSVTTMFSSYLPFQIEYSDWKVYKDTTAVPSDWNAVDFNDASWTSVKANAIGTSEAVTVYIRKEMNIPDIADYQVLNVRVKYAGGVVAYFNGRKVARFNLEEGFTSASESIAIHDSTQFSQFHIVLPTVRGVTGKNVIAFEIHRPTGQSSAEPVIFDATGVFGVNQCSIGVDSVIDVTGSPGTTIGNLENFFDLTPVTYGYQPNAAGTYLQWSVENLEGTRFNSFALETPYAATNIAFSLYGRSDAEEAYLSMFAETGLSTQIRKRSAWDVPVGIASFRQFKWEMDDAASTFVYASAFIFQYCKASGTNVCEGIDDYPGVGEGQISPAACPEGFRGYSYRTCTNGQLGEIQNDKCVYKLPAHISYSTDRFILVMNTQVNIAKPTYDNIIEKFYLAENTFLPDGLTLDETTGAITGVPTSEFGLKEYTIYGENPAGVTFTTLTISVRKGECRAEGNFPKTQVGEVAEYDCALGGNYVGTQKRACLLGAKDGEWQKIQGTCMPVMMIVILVVVVIIIVAIVVFFVMRATKKTKAVGGVKGKKSMKSTASKKGGDKKPSTKAVKV